MGNALLTLRAPFADAALRTITFTLELPLRPHVMGALLALLAKGANSRLGALRRLLVVPFALVKPEQALPLLQQLFKHRESWRHAFAIFPPRHPGCKIIKTERDGPSLHAPGDLAMLQRSQK